MAEGKKSFLIYCDIIDAIVHLTDAEKGKLFQQLLEYVNDMNPILDDRVLMGSWKHIELQLKRDLKKYESIKDRNSKNGAKGGRPMKPKEPNGLNENPNKPKKADTDNDTVTDTDNVKVIDIKKEKEVFNFRKSLIAFGFNERLVDDWMKVRKTKKATNTETALNSFLNECKRSNLENDSILQLCIERDWKGFKNEWLENKQNKNNDTNKPKSRLDRFIGS